MSKLQLLISGGLMLALAGACAPPVIAPVAKRPPGFVHVVSPGESLYRIAKAYDISPEELAQLNQLKNPNQIRVGQKLLLPGTARSVAVQPPTPAEPKLDRPEISEPREPAPDGFIWPLTGSINSMFGPRGTTVHDGIDIAAPEGTPIRAVEAGEVIYSDNLRGYGNLVIIRHAGGFASVYAHNQQNLVKEGQTVSRGEVIAMVGSTGRVSGPHLHFEIRRNNIAEDPLRYLPPLCCGMATDIVLPKDSNDGSR